MKTKEFDKIKPYTYVLIKKSNNKKYYGVRRRNIHLNTAPINDFGKNYKSSGGFCEEFKKYPNRFKVVFRWTFSSLEEAKEYEEKITKILIRKSQWKNWINKGKVLGVQQIGNKRRGLNSASKNMNKLTLTVKNWVLSGLLPHGMWKVKNF